MPPTSKKKPPKVVTRVVTENYSAINPGSEGIDIGQDALEGFSLSNSVDLSNTHLQYISTPTHTQNLEESDELETLEGLHKKNCTLYNDFKIVKSSTRAYSIYGRIISLVIATAALAILFSSPILVILAPVAFAAFSGMALFAKIKSVKIFNSLRKRELNLSRLEEVERALIVVKGLTTSKSELQGELSKKPEKENIPEYTSSKHISTIEPTAWLDILANTALARGFNFSPSASEVATNVHIATQREKSRLITSIDELNKKMNISSQTTDQDLETHLKQRVAILESAIYASQEKDLDQQIVKFREKLTALTANLKEFDYKKSLDHYFEQLNALDKDIKARKLQPQTQSLGRRIQSIKAKPNPGKGTNTSTLLKGKDSGHLPQI